MAYRKMGEGRLVTGLPERYEKAKASVALLEYHLEEIQGILSERSEAGDEITLDDLERYFRFGVKGNYARR